LCYISYSIFFADFLPLLNIKFNIVRPGTMYKENKTLAPVERISNGTLIAIGNVAQNEGFYNYGDHLNFFLLKDKKIKSILRSIFRRKFPMLWRNLGYYNKRRIFEIGNDQKSLF
jgi:hypothetical protein